MTLQVKSRIVSCPGMATAWDRHYYIRRRGSSDVPQFHRHGDRKGSPLLYTGLVSQLRACKMRLALLGSGCLALFLSFASKVLRRRKKKRRIFGGPFTLSPRQRSPAPLAKDCVLCTPDFLPLDNQIFSYYTSCS